MEKQHLIDFADWLWDMDRLKVTTQLPPFENSGMMVELYLKAKMLNDECEGKADMTSEKDLRVCEVIASACECLPEWRKTKIEENAFPYGDNLSFDECGKCGYKWNIHVV